MARPNIEPARRADVAWAGGVALASLGLFLSTFSTHVALGDAPESVSGIRSVGVLHAPGYPSYVLLARAYATLVPIGGWAARVNFFSVLCSVVAVTLVYVLARQFGAKPFPAALGAFTVATSVSFWFNAGFAKHYALSAALVVAAAVLVVAWERSGRLGFLIGAGLAIGLGIGASWELTVIMGAGLVALILFGSRRITLREAAAGLLCAAVLGAALLGFMVVRAGQDPGIDFGRPTTVPRLSDLVRQKDFLTGSEAPNGVRTLSKAPHRAAAYAHITVQEVGAAAVLLALVGAVVVARRRRLGETLFFGIVLIGNVVGAIFIAGLEHDTGIASGMVVGGFLIDLVVVIGVLVALGTTAAGDALVAWAASKRSDRAANASPRVLRAIVGVIAALALLLPSILVHEPYASHRGPALADNYAQRVLGELPQNAVLLTYGWEFGQPIRYRQIVFGERRDVVILSDAEAKLAWYSEQERHEFPSLAPAANLSYVEYISQFVVTAQRAGRSVYVDMSAIGLVEGSGLQIDGLIAKITTDTNIGVKGSITAQSRALHAAQAADGWLSGGRGTRFPNLSVSLFEMRADVVLAKIAVSNGDMQTTATQMRDAVTIRPDITANRTALRLVESGDPGAKAAVLALTTGEN